VVPIGAAAVVAQIQMRWLPYYVYRVYGLNWPGETSLSTFRIVSFLTLTVLLGIASGWHAVLNWTALGLFAWTIVLARHELKSVISSFASVKTRPG
jgi:hypothetical protein